MGRIAGARLSLDTAPVIYTVEQVAPFAAATDLRLSGPDIELVASDLTRLECRVKPLRDGNADLLQDFDNYFTNACTTIIGLTTEVIDKATEIWAIYGFRTPDAIHLAAAILANSDVFLTNDRRLDRFTELVVEAIRV
ncbi:MAG: hypothetical protein QOF51_1850 [Chloroflexota bacterium]|nr:hypothetical protein [Chloroflexota bacterium]